MSKPDELAVIKQFTDVLDQLHINYAIGGSMASSIYGTVRFTQDADITIAHCPDKSHLLYNLLHDDFYISEDAMQQAFNSYASFNIIHLATAFKIDIFIQNPETFEKNLIDRRQELQLSEKLKKKFSIVSPEDIILLKLKWYKIGNCQSDRQWIDIAGVIEVQKDKLDIEYLEDWAVKLGVEDLLEKALAG
mgnify:CR=1 FL=1